MINAAQSTLFITSFVAYDVSGIVKALNAADARGVLITMLLESSQDQGGSINMDVIAMMKALVPSGSTLCLARRRATRSPMGGCMPKSRWPTDTVFYHQCQCERALPWSGTWRLAYSCPEAIPRMLDDHLRAVATKVVSPV